MTVIISLRRQAGRALVLILAGLSFALSTAVMAHDGHDHDAAEKPTPNQQAATSPPTPPLPFDVDVGDGFDLVDQYGAPRNLKDHDGKYALVFFGYANCDAICSAAMPLMIAAIDALGEEVGTSVTPIMVTVDPARDTPEGLRESLPRYGEGIIGLTGEADELARVREAFHVEVEHVADDWDGSPIYSHGSFVYLMAPDGSLETLMPPVLAPEHMARIVKSYL